MAIERREVRRRRSPISPDDRKKTMSRSERASSSLVCMACENRLSPKLRLVSTAEACTDFLGERIFKVRRSVERHSGNARPRVTSSDAEKDRFWLEERTRRATKKKMKANSPV